MLTFYVIFLLKVIKIRHVGQMNGSVIYELMYP